MILFYVLSFLSFQDLNYERLIIDSLTSHRFHGRGYEFCADKKVARFLRNEYRKIGLKAINDNYFQYFSVETNLFEQEPSLSINKKKLCTGKDYLPHPSSSSGSGNFTKNEIVVFTEAYFKSTRLFTKLRNKVVLVDETLTKGKNLSQFKLSSMLSLFNRLTVKALFIRADNLIYSKPFFFSNFPIFILKKDSSRRSIEKINFSILPERRKIESQNVIGRIKGETDSSIVLMAHYDHLGAIGDSIYFAGANDNASGVAMMLAIAKELKKINFKYSIYCILFSGEESGLRGSKYFIKHPSFDLKKIKFILNLDMVASGENEIVIVGGKEFNHEYNRIYELNNKMGHVRMRRRANVAISDHYYFLKEGVKGFYIYTNKGKQPYHNVLDLMGTLEWDDFFYVKNLLISFIKKL